MRRPWSPTPTPHRSTPHSIAARGIQSAQIGASILQTPGGVQDELARIHTDFELFEREFDATMARPGSKSNQTLADLYEWIWQPLLVKWKKWYEENNGWWGNFWWNHAPTAEQYLAQLGEIRERAKKAGMDVASPTPATFSPSILFDPSHNIIDETADKLRKNLTTVAVVAAAGIGAAFLLSRR